MSNVNEARRMNPVADWLEKHAGLGIWVSVEIERGDVRSSVLMEFGVLSTSRAVDRVFANLAAVDAAGFVADPQGVAGLSLDLDQLSDDAPVRFHGEHWIEVGLGDGVWLVMNWE